MPFGRIKAGLQKPEQRWDGFNSIENGFLVINNILIVIFANETYRSWEPDSRGYKNIYKIYTEEKWNKLPKITTTTESPLSRNPGTAFVLPNSRIAIVIKDEVNSNYKFI